MPCLNVTHRVQPTHPDHLPVRGSVGTTPNLATRLQSAINLVLFRETEKSVASDGFSDRLHPQQPFLRERSTYKPVISSGLRSRGQRPSCIIRRSTFSLEWEKHLFIRRQWEFNSHLWQAHSLLSTLRYQVRVVVHSSQRPETYSRCGFSPRYRASHRRPSQAIAFRLFSLSLPFAQLLKLGSSLRSFGSSRVNKLITLHP